MQISHYFPGENPGPPPEGGGDPLPHPPPFRATRLSEAFGFIGHLSHPIPAVKVLDPPLLYEYNCRCILDYWNDYGMFIFYKGKSDVSQISSFFSH